MLNRKVGLLPLSIAVMHLGLSIAACQIRSVHHGDASSELAKRIQGFRADGVPWVDGVLQLADAANEPIGLECLTSEGLEKPINFSFPGGTLSNALDAIFAHNNKCSWHMQDGVIAITPLKRLDHKANLLDHVLPRLSLKRCSLQEASHQLGMELWADLHPGIGIAGEYDPGLGGQMIGPLELKNITVRQALNQLVREAGQAAWIVTVPPNEMAELPASGLWLVVEYKVTPRMQRASKLILGARYPLRFPDSPP